jgi:hypothetical protein
MTTSQKEAMVRFGDLLIDVMSGLNSNLYEKKIDLLEQKRSIEFSLANINTQIRVQEEKIRQIRSGIRGQLKELYDE